MAMRPGRWVLHAPIAVLPFLAALVLESPEMRADLSRRVSENLVASGSAAWATTALDGRDVTLSGEAPDEAAAAAALNAAAATYGVRRVTSLVRVAQPANQQ